MKSQPATKKDIKELLTDFGKVHAKEFKHIRGKLSEHNAKFEVIDKRFDRVDSEIESIKILHSEDFATMNAKLDRLLTDTALQRLSQRVQKLEKAVFQ